MVSVVIPVRDGVDVIDEQLSALADQDYPGPFEVIVADNGRPTRCVTTSTVIRWPTVSVCGGSTPRDFLAPPMRVTRAVRVAAGDFIAFCDADDRVYPEWLRELTAVAAYSEAVGGAVETHSSIHPRAVLATDAAAGDPYEIHRYLRVSPTCSFGIWRQMFDKIGGFDIGYNRVPRTRTWRSVFSSPVVYSGTRAEGSRRLSSSGTRCAASGLSR